ncbi:MAG TPA: glycolate oxidase subunit GlcE [Burkholderiales bacterium]|nr:glycolate oxidase subunit GlcE [Burkholderiales bacterium]
MTLAALQDQIRVAAERAAPLQVRGGGSKDFYGNEPRGELLDTRSYAGIVDYEPSELVLTARGGTALAEVEAIVGAKGQCLPFEPPHFGAATLGGCVAAGLSGPRRAAAGALRDFVLGVKLIDGRGRVLEFGGRVMKNVAGYDVSRLVAGSLGTLGVIAEASVKVLPRPPAERTLRFDMDQTAALDAMNVWAGEPLPISATAWHDGALYVRLAGSPAAVQAATPRLGGAEVGDSMAFWRAIREQTYAFFAGDQPLWRIAVPSAAAPLGLAGNQLLEWNGALRWLRSRASAEEVRAAAKRAGGHATLFRARDKSAGAFTPLDPVLLRLHRALKSAFDPAGILNPGRMYAEF